MAQEPDLPPSGAAFEVARRGYHQGQVDHHLRRLDTKIQILVTDREAALDQSAQLARELDKARAHAEQVRMESSRHSVQEMSQQARSMLHEARQMFQRAEQQISKARAELEAQRTAAAEQIAADRQRAEQKISKAHAELEAQRTAAAEQIAADHERAERERAASWADSESRRKEVEDDFTIAMNRRRTEALTRMTEEREHLAREVHATRTRVAAQARAHLEQARTRAQTVTAEATRRVHELTELRSRIIEQLGGAHGTLGQTLTALQPIPEEQGPNAQPDTTHAADPASTAAPSRREPAAPTAAGATPAPTTEKPRK